MRSRLFATFILTSGNDQADAMYLTARSAAENTERNVRDKSGTTLTLEKQNKSDVKITANIRKAVVADKSMSVDARNVKIITRNGIVTLRGAVENESESMKLQHSATQTPGAVQVDNQLEIKAP